MSDVFSHSVCAGYRKESVAPNFRARKRRHPQGHGGVDGVGIFLPLEARHSGESSHWQNDPDSFAAPNLRALRERVADLAQEQNLFGWRSGRRFFFLHHTIHPLND